MTKSKKKTDKKKKVDAIIKEDEYVTIILYLTHEDTLFYES